MAGGILDELMYMSMTIVWRVVQDIPAILTNAWLASKLDIILVMTGKMKRLQAMYL